MAYLVTEQDIEQAITKIGKELAEETNPKSEYNYLIVRKQIGPLSRKEIAQILTESAIALDKIYPVPGSKPLPNKVDSRGRYGAYRLTIQQLVDSAYIDKEVIAWAQGGLNLHGDGPYESERRSSYADESIKKNDTELDFAAPRTEERNNVQYYLLNNEPPSYIRHYNVSNPISNFVRNSIVNQNTWAYNYLEFVYKLFLTARILDEDDLIFEEDEEKRRESVRSLAGLLTVALCESYDAATSLAAGREKINTDGISSKYWYSIGYNAIVATANEKKPFPEPEPVKSPDVTAVTNVSSEATSETPTPETASAPASTTTDNGTPNAVPQKSDTPPPAASPEQVATAAPPEKPKASSASSSGTGYKIDYLLEGSTFSARGVLVGTNKLVCSGAESDRNSLKSTLIDQLDRQLTKASSKTKLENPLEVIKSVGSINLYWSGNAGSVTIKINGLNIKSITVTDTNGYLSSTTISNLVDDLAALKVGITDPKVALTYTQIINYFTGASGYKKDIESVKEAYSTQQQGATDAEALEALKNDINNNFLVVTEPLENQKNIPTTEAQESSNADGTSSTTVTTVYEDGSKTVVTTTTTADGTLTTEKTVVPVAPAANVSPPKAGEDLDQVRDPDKGSPAIAVGRNSEATFNATNQPSNSDVIPSDPSKGFQDPNNQYPKKDSVNKPDTNTLAVGINSPSINADPRSPAGDRKSTSPGASPAARNASRKREVKTAGRNGTTWSQPESPYAAQYPYNKVFGGESGHALEIDDTPGAERLNFAHRSGTFDEIGPDGTKVTKIVGDGYTIYDNDGYILIEGSANVHLAGACNVYIAGDTNLTMHGKASIDVHNDLDLNVGGHIAVSAGKGIFVRNQGIFSLDNVGDIEMRSKGKLTQEVVGTYNITTTGGYNMTSKANSNVKISGISYTTSTGDMNFCTDGVFKAKSAGDMNMLTAAVMNQESAGAFNNKSGAAVNVEGAGNINLKAPLVASSPIDTPTLDVTTANVSTLNAGNTNLRATGTDTGTNGGSTHDLPISGPTSASVTAPASATSAVEADCASVAPLSKPVPLELPVSVSKGSAPASSAGVGASNTSNRGGGGGGDSNVATDGGELDSEGTNSDHSSADCAQGEGNQSTDGSTENGVDPSNSSGGSEAAGPFQSKPPAACGGANSGLPAIPAMNPKRPDMSFKLSPNYTLKDFMQTKESKSSSIVPFGRWGTVDILANMRCILVNVVEPARKQFPGLIINSAYRQYSGNTSAHPIGAAVDLRIPGKKTDGRAHLQLAEWIARNCPGMDQIIFENGGGPNYWVHVGVVNQQGAVRGQKFSMVGSSSSKPKRVNKGLSASMTGFVMT